MISVVSSSSHVLHRRKPIELRLIGKRILSSISRYHHAGWSVTPVNWRHGENARMRNQAAESIRLRADPVGHVSPNDTAQAMTRLNRRPGAHQRRPRRT